MPANRSIPLLTRALRRVALAVCLTGAAVVSLAPLQKAQARLPADGFVDLAAELTKVAVTINTAQTVERPKREGPNLAPDNPFGDFFKDFFEQGPDGPRRMESQGSGFVIDAEGFIVTNNHVINGAQDIIVEFSDGETYDAELVGADEQTDIALLRIKPEGDLEFARFGDSDKVQVGELVLAIGNPFGQGFSVSAGIISALDRDINAGRYDRFLQTDAAINRGNSGGPLINMAGEVIGVNTAIISPSGGSIGIGFSVPSNLAVSVIQQLREHGEVRRGWLGVLIQGVDEAIAASLGLDRAYGAMVSKVEENSPADKGGVKKGDVITRFNRREITTMKDLPRIVANTPAGARVPVEVFRDGEYENLSIEIELLDEERLAGAAEAPAGEEGSAEASPEVVDLPDLGLGFATLDDAARKRFKIDPEIVGVLIVEVDEASAAYEKGLRPGDVLLEVQQDPVASPDEAVKRIEESRAGDRNAVLLMVARGDSRRFVAVEFTR